MIHRTDGVSLRTGFLRQASIRPDSPAFVVRGVSRNYGEVEQTARRWARALTRISGDRPRRVGLFAFRSETAYTGTLAALFSGAAYVPLNPTFPAEKNAAMIREADLDVVIVDRTCESHLQPVLAGLPAIPLLTPDSDEIEGLHSKAPITGKSELADFKPLDDLPPIAAEDMAYLLFTSGSTGLPKGVPVTHANAVYFMDVMARRYNIVPQDRFSQTFDQTFDLSVFDLFMAWTNGACVYGMAPVDLLSPTRFINNHKLTVWFSVPSVPAQMCRRNTLLPNSLPTLRLSLFCGEPLVQRSAEMWHAAAPNSVLENLYGPTELTIACFLHRWDPKTSPGMCRNGVVPIGRPYDGLAALIIDSGLKAVLEGQAGELCVNGPQTTPGYWKNSTTTDQRYVMLPFSDHETRRFYRTGDLVTTLPGGEFVFLGRVDHQIKVLGHRVELGEIEATLRSHPGVVDAIACPWPELSPTTAEGIVAFVTGNEIDIQALIALAKAQLPPYIVPRQIYVLSEMPLNPNGKVDRRVLQERLRAEAAESPTIIRPQ